MLLAGYFARSPCTSAPAQYRPAPTTGSSCRCPALQWPAPGRRRTSPSRRQTARRQRRCRGAVRHRHERAAPAPRRRLRLCLDQCGHGHEPDRPGAEDHRLVPPMAVPPPGRVRAGPQFGPGRRRRGQGGGEARRRLRPRRVDHAAGRRGDGRVLWRPRRQADASGL